MDGEQADDHADAEPTHPGRKELLETRVVFQPFEKRDPRSYAPVPPRTRVKPHSVPVRDASQGTLKNADPDRADLGHRWWLQVGARNDRMRGALGSAARDGPTTIDIRLTLKAA